MENLRDTTIPGVIAIMGLVFLCVEQAGHRGRHIGWWGAILVAFAFILALIL